MHALNQGFSINFLQGPNYFEQNAEGPNAHNRQAPVPIQDYESRCRNSKKGNSV